MVGTIFRVLLGLIAANLAAGVVLASFIVTPADLMALKGEALTDRLTGLGALILLAATQSAVFAGPLALIGIVFAELRWIRSPFFYALLGLAVAGAGFLMQHLSGGGATTVAADPYALTAYGTTGLVAGLVYWWTPGRGAGGRQAPKVQRSAT
jgi:hypothetical protein